MPRRKPSAASRRGPRRPPSRGSGGDLPPVEDKHDGQWHARRLTGASSRATYTCPGCHRAIPPATPHVVAWPVLKPLLSAEAVDERRHWHTDCWNRRP